MHNLRSTSNFASSFWDWTFLNGCFGSTRIRVSDIDGIVERNGQFLVIETKKPHEAMSGGQKIMYQQLTSIKAFTLLVVVGEVNIPQRAELWDHTGIRHFAPASIETVKAIVSGWFDRANRHIISLPVIAPTPPISVICGLSGLTCNLCPGVPCENSIPRIL